MRRRGGGGKEERVVLDRRPQDSTSWIPTLCFRRGKSGNVYSKEESKRKRCLDIAEMVDEAEDKGRRTRGEGEEDEEDVSSSSSASTLVLGLQTCREQDESEKILYI